MVVAGLLFVGLTAGVKHMGSGIPAAQSAFLRYFLGLIFVLPMLFVVRNERPSLRVWGFFGLRGLMHTFGVILWFYAMTRIPLAEVSAMGYMSPVFISIGAAVFLGERLRMRRLAAVAVAIIGAMVILRPGLRELNDGHIAMLFTSIFFALSYMMAKRTSRDASPTMVVTMLSITVTIGLAPFAFAVWVPVSGAELLWLLMIAGFATAGHYCMTFAFAAAPITVTQPVTALQLVWAVSLGALLFAEPVDLWVVAGGALIVLAVVFIALREHQVKLAEAREVMI
ncbi:EamA family transporter [Pararhodobacter oceanensis]|uniref:EamA family transporter n=2 Tax=Pararhodobacter oceanensis TaxID=2172121 RepID=A0A2T8HX48_9RHOB|nr:EamA family transporter [Pararhodobacter oceanensis]